MVAGFRMPFVGPPCIYEVHFRHRAASVVDSLRPAATVAAWHPGPVEPVRGGQRFRQASSPPVQARRFAATFPVPSPPAFIHARRNDLFQSFLPIPRRQPALASVLHFVRTWICYVRCLRIRLPPDKHSQSPIRITPRHSHLQQIAKRSSHRTRSVGQRSLPQNVQFVFSS